MEGPQPDPEQTERLLFFSSQADDKFSTTINEFYASVRQQCQTTKALHVFSNGRLSPSQTNRLFATSQKASQQPYIDSLKDTERELQRSLQASQKETEAENERCTAQQSLVADMESKLRQLKIELEWTRAKVECAGQLYDTQDGGVSDLNLDTQQLEDAVDRNAAGMDPTLKENPPRANTARKRHNNDDLEVDPQRPTKRRLGTPTANALDVSTVSDTLQRQSNLAKETEAEKQQHGLTTTDNVKNTVSSYNSHTAKKLAYLEQIRRSPWAHDTSESAQRFIESLTPALCVNVLSRLVELSRSYSAQQVVLHIDLEQLHRVGGKREGSSIVSPIVKSGFTIAEKHISRFPKLSFDSARLDKLLKYRLNCTSFGPALDGKTLGLKPSGLFTLVSRQDSLTAAKTLRKCFDAETIASIRAAATKSHENEEAIHPSGRPEIAPDQDAPDIQARLGLGDQNDGRSTSPTDQASSNQVNRLHGQIQTDVTSIAVESGGGGGSERAKANGQLNDDIKGNSDKILETGRLRNAAGTTKVRRKTRSKKKNGSSQDTAGANSRPKRTPKPSRRAAEAASAK